MKKYLIHSICGLIYLTSSGSCFAQDSVQTAEGQGMWESTKGVASDTWNGTKEVTSDTWNGTKEVTSDVWNGTKKVTSDIWDGTKKVARDVKDGVAGEDTPPPDNSVPQETHRQLPENTENDN